MLALSIFACLLVGFFGVALLSVPLAIFLGRRFLRDIDNQIDGGM